MAKRLNKNMVVGLTATGMLLTTAAGVLMVMNLPGRDPAQYVQRAEDLTRQKDYAEAMKSYQRAWGCAREGKYAGQANEYLILAGDMALKAGLAREARSTWDRVMLSDPGNEKAQERIVKFLIELANLGGGGNWGRLQAEAEKLAGENGINPSNYVGLHALGLALVKQTAVDPKYAESGGAKLIAAVNGDKSNPEYARSLAQEVYFRANKLDEAKHVYDVLIEEHASEDPKELAKAYLYRGTFYLQKMAQALEQLRRGGGTIAPAELTVIRQQVAQDDQRARNDLEKAVKLAPDNTEALVGLGQYWEFKPSDATDEAARQSETTGYREEGRKLYERAILADPDDFAGYRRLAELYRSQDKYDEALKVLRGRLDRGVNRDHYLGWLNLFYMSMLRDDAFRMNMGKLFALPAQAQDEQQREAGRKAILDEMWKLYNESVAEAPGGEQDASTLFMKGRLLMLEGKLSQAIQALEQAETLLTGIRPDLKRTLAALYLQTQLPGPAKEALRPLLEAFPNDEGMQVMMASAHLQSYDPGHPEELERAMATAQRVLAINPKSRDALAILGRVYQMQKNVEGAKRIQERLDEGVDPISKKLHEATALRLQWETDPSLLMQSESLLGEVLAADPLNLAALQELVQLYMVRIDTATPDAKAKLVSQITKTLTDARATANKKRDEAAATQPAGEATERYRRVGDVIDRLAVLANPNTSDEEKVMRMAELINKGDNPYLVAMQLFDVYRRSPKHADQAYAQLKKAQELKPEDPDTLEILFRMAIGRKDWAQAEECIQKATKQGFGVSSGGHFYRGRLLLARGVDDPAFLTQARDEILAGLEQFPNHTLGRTWLGEVYLRLQQYDKATEAFEEARRLNPRSGPAAIGLAMAADIRGDQKALEQYLATCAEVEPNHPWVQARMKQLDEQANPKKGIKVREALREKDPKDLANLLVLADLYARDGQAPAAIRTYEEGRKLDPADLGVARQYARFLTSQKPPDMVTAEKVLRELAKAVESKDTESRAVAQVLLASHLWQMAQQAADKATSQARLDEADQAFRDGAKIMARPAMFMDIGNHFRQTGRLEEAESWFRQAITASQGASLDDQRNPRRLLMETLLLSHENTRFDEVQKEIGAYRSLFPDDPVGHLYQGRLDAARADDAKAIESFTSYIQKVPEQPIGYYHRAVIHLRRSDWPAAIKDLREVKRLEPGFANYQPRMFLAQALENSGRTDAAIEELQSVLAEDSSIEVAAQTLLRVYAALRRWDGAEALVAPRAKAEPNRPLWPRLLSWIAIERGDADGAVRNAREATEKSDNAPNLLDEYLATCMRFGRFDDVITFVNEKLPAEKRSSQALLRLGSAHAGKNEADKAIDCYLRALQTDRPAIDSLGPIVIEDLARRLNVDAAIQAIAKRMDADPKALAPKVLHLLTERMKNGPAAFIRAARELLANVSDEQLKKEPVYQFAIRELAIALHSDKQFEEARKLYEKVLAVDEGQTAALNNLAYLLMTDLADPKAALPYAEKAAKLAPENPAVLDTLGWNYVLLGRYDDSVGTLRGAIEINAMVPAIHYHAGEAFFRRANSAGARDPEADKNEARTEIRRAHELILSSQRDTEGILPKIVELGKQLGLTLEEKLPGPASIASP